MNFNFVCGQVLKINCVVIKHDEYDEVGDILYVTMLGQTMHMTYND